MTVLYFFHAVTGGDILDEVIQMGCGLFTVPFEVTVFYNYAGHYSSSSVLL